MKAHYYKHEWQQEPDSRSWKCSACEERTVYYPRVGQYVTLWTEPDCYSDKCMRVIDYEEEQ